MKLKSNVFLALLLSSFFILAAYAQESDIAVVVNSNNAVTSLTTSELRKILAGEKRTWPGGQPVKLFVRAPGTAERIAVLKVLGMSEGDYKKYWTSQVFRGEAQTEPVMLPSNGMQKEAVQAFPGAIVLMPVSEVRTGMKIVKVDGHLPGEHGYSLQ
jgi:hypothetical protein